MIIQNSFFLNWGWGPLGHKQDYFYPCLSLSAKINSSCGWKRVRKHEGEAAYPWETSLASLSERRTFLLSRRIRSHLPHLSWLFSTTTWPSVTIIFTWGVPSVDVVPSLGVFNSNQVFINLNVKSKTIKLLEDILRENLHALWVWQCLFRCSTKSTVHESNSW